MKQGEWASKKSLTSSFLLYAVETRLIASLLVLVLCLVLLVSCSKPSLEKTLCLGYMPNVTHATALVGIEKNIFQEQLGETSLKPVCFLVGNSIIDAFITNQIDIAYIGPGPFINALYRKVPLELLSGAADGGTLIVGTVPIEKTTKIAVPQYGNTQDLILKMYIKEKKINTSKIKFLAIPSQDTATAFFTMSIDAACLPEPWGTILTEKMICQVLENEKSILNNGNYPVTLLVVNKKYAKEHSNIVSRFINAHNITTSLINNNPQEAVNIVQNVISKISKKQVNRDIIVNSLGRCMFTSDVDLNILKDFERIGIESGYYKKRFLNENHIN